jgi:hypothetical protein
MSRTTPEKLYEEDFYAWTQSQAAALRLVHLPSNEIDVANIAEELEADTLVAAIRDTSTPGG